MKTLMPHLDAATRAALAVLVAARAAADDAAARAYYCYAGVALSLPGPCDASPRDHLPGAYGGPPVIKLPGAPCGY